jgi:large subunit ribosomal protein L25
MQTVTVNGTPREATGKTSSKEARREGLIPCVMYGGDDNVHFTTTLKDVKTLIYTPDFKIAEVNVNGESHRCILKDVQYHPVKDTVRHIDFLKLVEGRAIKINLPVKFIGSSPGVKVGGKLIQNLRKIKVKTTPEKMIDSMTLDISGVQLGHAIRVRDLQVEEGIEVLNPGGTPVASVEIPRALRSAEAAAAATTEAK